MGYFVTTRLVPMYWSLFTKYREQSTPLMVVMLLATSYLPTAPCSYLTHAYIREEHRERESHADQWKKGEHRIGTEREQIEQNESDGP